MKKGDTFSWLREFYQKLRNKKKSLFSTWNLSYEEALKVWNVTECPVCKKVKHPTQFLLSAHLIKSGDSNFQVSLFHHEYQRTSRLTWQWNRCTNEASKGTDHFKTNQSFTQEYVTDIHDAEELPQKLFQRLVSCRVVVSREKVQWPNFATRCDKRKLQNGDFRVFVGVSARELKPDFVDNNQIQLSTGCSFW